MDARLWPGQGRLVEAEEEDYFNTDDDEDDDIIPSISSQWARGQAPASSLNTLKRKRRVTVGGVPRGFRPLTLNPLRSPPPLGTLVDYDEDEDDLGTLGPIPENPPAATRSTPPAPALSPGTLKLSPPSMEMPASPKLSHRQIPPSPPSKRPSSDDEDSVLEALVRAKPGPPLPSAGISLGPMRPAEKRRRDDDDDDGLLERLSKAKKPDLGAPRDGPATGGRTGSTKLGDDPPKKLKLNLRAMSLGAASPSPPAALSETGVKDGDRG